MSPVNAPGDLFTKLKVTEQDGRISLTNLAVYTVLFLFSYTVLRSGIIDLTALGTLLTALGAYRLKAHQVEKTETRKDDTESLKAEVQALKAERDTMRRELDRAALTPKKAPGGGALPAGLR